jgi:hypothetical protein
VRASVGAADAPLWIYETHLDTWQAPDGAPFSGIALRNPELREPAVQLRPDSALAALLYRLPAGLNAPATLDILFNEQAFDKSAIVGQFLAAEFRSYWGWFGWLSLPLQLPEDFYRLAGLAMIGAAVGWALGWRQVPGQVRLLGAMCELALLGLICLTLLRHLTNWGASGLRDFPQGRYLFVLLIPAIWLLLAGWGYGLAGLRRLLARALPAPPLAWIAGYALVALGCFDLYALVGIVLPYYYGRF